MDPELAEEMCVKRSNAALVTPDADHFVHKGDRAGFAAAVRDFLQSR
ncbi:hypothetical protein [Nocardia sp. NPDC057440]